MDEKKCTKCGVVKGLGEYWKGRVQCKQCLAVYNKAYGEANKAKKEAYREANKDKIAAYDKVYREANKDKIADYREAYKDRIAAYHKAYGEANKDKIADYKEAYREANKDKIAAYNKAYGEANKDNRSAKAFLFNRFGISGEDLPPDLLSAKIEQLKLTRELRTAKKELNNGSN